MKISMNFSNKYGYPHHKMASNGEYWLFHEQRNTFGVVWCHFDLGIPKFILHFLYFVILVLYENRWKIPHSVWILHKVHHKVSVAGTSVHLGEQKQICPVRRASGMWALMCLSPWAPVEVGRKFQTFSRSCCSCCETGIDLLSRRKSQGTIRGLPKTSSSVEAFHLPVQCHVR